MKFTKTAFCLLWAASVHGVVPEVQATMQDDLVPGHQSLPNLLTVNSIQDLHLNWQTMGSMVLDAGRLVVTEKAGAIWSASTLANSRDEWTVEVVFRNSEKVDVDDHSFVDTNGFAFWLVQPSSSQLEDFLNYGGPQKYDGFQFLVNNKNGPGIKIFANDGSRAVANSVDTMVGTCGINYLDSMVPFTLRVSYSKSRQWFKVQIDNDLCFKTDLISFDRLGEDLKFGASASVHPGSQEYWEVLKLNVYEQLTPDAIDDHGIISNGAIKTVTVTENTATQDKEFHPSSNRESLMERSMRMKEQLAQLAQKEQEQNQGQQQNVHSNLADISFKLSVLEHKLNSDAIKVGDLAIALEDMRRIQGRQLQVLEELRLTYDSYETLLASQYKEIVQSIGQLHEQVISEIKEHHSGVNDINRKVDLLMENHQEIQSQYAGTDTLADFSALFNSMVRWVLLPIVLGIVVLTAFVHRLRKDIKHSKLL